MASLKPAFARVPCVTQTQFHDRAVVASLKLADWTLHGITSSAIPRPRGRGLIEASGTAGRVAGVLGIPRPRGRGLIEAGHAVLTGSPPAQFHDRAVVASLKLSDEHLHVVG